MNLIIRLFILLTIIPLLASCAREPKLTAARTVRTDAHLATTSATRRNDPPAILSMAEAERAINSYRQKYNLQALKAYPMLISAAKAHAKDLARSGKVSHYGSNGSNPAQRLSLTGYKWSTVGENVSAGRNSITEVIQAWHNSPPHRRNLQKPHVIHFGLAVAHNPKSTLSNYWVLIVAAPAKSPLTRMSIGG